MSNVHQLTRGDGLGAIDTPMLWLALGALALAWLLLKALAALDDAWFAIEQTKARADNESARADVLACTVLAMAQGRTATDS